MVRHGQQQVWLAAGEGAADDRPPAKRPGPQQGFANVVFLDTHSAHHDEVGPEYVRIEQSVKASVD